MKINEKNSIEQRDVVLISMPFGSLLIPSIALGLLKASLKPWGITTKTLYFTLRFAERVGYFRYSRITEGLTLNYDLIGEWLFAEALFPGQLDTEGYLENILRNPSPAYDVLTIHKREVLPEEAIQVLLEVRSQVSNFLDDCLTEVLRYQPKVVGFTSVFQQQIPSLALAKRIKQQLPETFIIFGGANCEGVMGTEVIKQFPFVDAVVSGEGDLIFPEMVQRILGNQSIFELPGVYTRQGNTLNVNGRRPNTPLVKNLDALPIPDYDDYFEQWQIAEFKKEIPPFVPFETSRGCWWGEKHHCTFCGLNGVSMMYRSKSASRALDELIELGHKYPDCRIQAVDNIFNMQYFKDFVPNLAQHDLQLELFFEVKANLKKEQLRQLREAGVIWIQPGIESLDNSILKRMHKGVRALQNIQLLKWCKELNITPFWNILWGFPGEPPDAYQQMAQLVPLLTHLPPGGFSTVRLDRFSPNFVASEQHGFTNVTPYPAYHYIYPFDSKTIANLAYFFVYQYRKPQDVKNYTQPLADQIKTWNKVYPQSDLLWLDREPYLLIFDFRPAARKSLVVLTGPSRMLYLACDTIQPVSRLQQLLQKHTKKEEVSTQDVKTFLKPLLDQGLMIAEDNAYLSLAISLKEYVPKQTIQKRYEHLLKQFDEKLGSFRFKNKQQGTAKHVL